MPVTRKLLPQEIEDLVQQGYKREDLQGEQELLTPEEQQPMSKTGAALAALGHGAGGFAGGGAGALGGMAAAGPVALAAGIPTGGIGALAVELGAATLGGLGGAFLGQKAQQAILPDSANKYLEEQYQKAQTEHPVVTTGTDIIASALASGGKPSLSNIPKALSGDRAALQSIVLNSAINPAINAGVSYTTSSSLPSGKELAAQALGGAVFSNQAKWASRLLGHPTETATEPTQEPQDKSGPDVQVSEPTPATTERVSPYTEKVDDLHSIDATGIKQAWAAANPKPDLTGLSQEDAYQQMTQWRATKRIPIPEMRDRLHEQFLKKQDELSQIKIPAPSDTTTVEEAPPIEQTPGIKTEPTIVPAAKIEDILPQAKPERLSADEENKMRKQVLNAPPSEEPTGKQQYDAISDKMKVFQEKGDYQNPEFMKLWKEREEVKNKFAGGQVPLEAPAKEEQVPVTVKQGTTPSLVNHIREGKATTQSVLEHISKQERNDYSPLAEYYLKTADAKSLGRPIVHDRSLGILNSSRSNYDPNTDQISLSTDSLMNSHDILHEIGHQVLSKKLPNEFDGLRGASLKKAMDNYLEKGSNEPIKELIRTYYEAAKHLGIHDTLFSDEPFIDKSGISYPAKGLAGLPEQASKLGLPHGYAMGNLDEYTTMLASNKKFQAHMNELPSGLNDGKSLWSRIVEAVRRVLGVPVKQGSLLERALKPVDELVGQERPGEKGSIPREERMAPPNEAETNPKERYGFYGLTSTFDKVREHSTMLSEAFHRWRGTVDKIAGPGTASIQDQMKYPQEVVDKVVAARRAAYRDGTPLPKFNKQEQEVYDLRKKYFFDYTGQMRVNEGPRINGREPGTNENYEPDTMNEKALDTFTSNPLSPEAKHLEQKWVDYVVRQSEGNVPKEEAQKNISAYLEALGGKDVNYRTIEYGPIRKASGYGMPEGMRDLDGIKSQSKYNNRFASDMAFFKEIQNRPEIAGSLKIKDTSGNIPQHPNAQPELAKSNLVKDAMQWVTGSYRGHTTKNAAIAQAFIRLYNNSIMGTATGIRNTAQVPVMAIPYIHSFGDLKAFFTGMTKFREEARNALETGARKPQMDKVQFDQIKESPNQWVALAQKLGTLMRKWQGREAMENFDRNITFAGGKELLRYNVIGAKNGNANSIKLLKKFSLLVDGDITHMEGQPLEDALNQMAKNFVDRNQGTYGGSGLPLWAVDSPFAPFFSLQKWSIEKSNVIYQDVVKPFLKGEDYVPMLTYTLGTIMTGAAIQKLNEILTNRKGQDPTLKEVAAHPDPVSVVSELATLMQLSSYGGIIGDGLKGISDVGLHGKSPRNIVSFPTATAAVDLEEKTKYMLEALRNGEDPWEVWKKYSLDLMSHNVQLARQISNYTTESEKMEDTDKFRDVRVFNELEGKPASDFTASNPYLNIEQGEFKHEKDVSKAAQELPALISDIIRRYSDDPEQMKKKFEALKANNYNVMPSLQQTPMAFMRYLNFLKNRDGQEAATSEMMDWIKRNSINKAKGALVP